MPPTTHANPAPAPMAQPPKLTSPAGSNTEDKRFRFVGRQPILDREGRVAMVGRDRLMRWLHLLLFASDDLNGLADPLCQLSSTRGTLMETLANEANDPELNPNRAGLAGLLSLAPALLGLGVKDVCRKLSPEYSIEKALLRREGPIAGLAGNRAPSRSHRPRLARPRARCPRDDRLERRALRDPDARRSSRPPRLNPAPRAPASSRRTSTPENAGSPTNRRRSRQSRGRRRRRRSSRRVRPRRAVAPRTPCPRRRRGREHQRRSRRAAGRAASGRRSGSSWPR